MGYADSPLQPIVGGWLNKIKAAQEVKAKRFGRDAAEGVRFLTGNLSAMYDNLRADDKFRVPTGDGAPNPSYRMSLNKTAELVQLFGPALYHRNPVRTVLPRRFPDVPAQLFGPPGDPAAELMIRQYAQGIQQAKTVDGARATLLSAYLNATPSLLDLKTESRWAIDEAIIKGMGCLWCLSGGTEVYAKYGDRHAVVRIRDLFRNWQNNVSLWDGQKWVRVVGAKKKPRQGGELKITLRSGESINCTPEHRWPLAGKVVRADELRVGDCLLTTKLPQPDGVHNPASLSDDIGWFVGLCLADGHIDASKREVKIGIACHIADEPTHARIEQFVKAYGGTVTFRGEAGTKKWDAAIYSRVLVAVLREFINGDGAYKKYLSPACWNRSDVFLRNLLDGYLAGDGHYVKNEGVWKLGFCRNKALASSIRTLCARLGTRLTLKVYTHKNGSGTYTAYRGVVRYSGVQGVPPPVALKDLGEITAIEPADWRCDEFYDIAVDSEPHLFALASGVLTHNCEPWTAPGSPNKLIGSFFDSVDNLLIDPDAESLRDAKWIARRCCHPVWEVERKYGLPPGTLRGDGESLNARSEVDADADGDYKRKTGRTNDLVTYWKVYSKMGVGGRLSGVSPDVRNVLDGLGDFCLIVVSHCCNYPLNLPPALTSQPGADDATLRAVQWETPFWADDGWPFRDVSFHHIPRDPWPQSHLSPGMGELKFLNWAYSFVAGKIATTCRDFIALPRSAADEFRNRILSGRDLELLEIEDENWDAMKDIVRFVQHPQFNGDIWKVIEAVTDQFERRVGLTELMYGQSGVQLRSAAEADLKAGQLNVRPDDMANKVEDAMSALARSEALAARWHLTPDDVAPVLGPDAAQLWGQLVYVADPSQIVHQLEYRVEAGSTRRPNKSAEQQNMRDAMQNVFAPLLQVCSAVGDMGPVNALVRAWGKSIDLNTDDLGIVFPAPPPPMPAGPAPGPGGPPPASEVPA